jgi:hypothetical protein
MWVTTVGSRNVSQLDEFWHAPMEAADDGRQLNPASGSISI